MKEWVYLVTNPVMPNLVKLGYSSKDPDTRKAKFEQQNTALPANYEFQYKGLMENAFQVESKAHQILEQYRYTSTKFVAGNEWFECDLLTALNAIHQASESEIVYEEFYNDLEQILKNQDDDLDKDFDLEKYEQVLLAQRAKQEQIEKEKLQKQQKIKEQNEAKDLLQAAVNGNADAQFELSQIYLHGNSVVSKNQDKATEWLEKACQNGSKKAARFITQQEKIRLEKKQEIERIKAEKLQNNLLKSAAQGNADAQFELSQIYLYGNLAIKRNRDKAKEWLELAYRNGSIKAAEFIKQPEKKKLEKIYKALFKAAINGDADAQFELSQIYLYGNLAVSKNQNKAKEWFELAYSNGSIKAAALIRQQEEKRLEKIKEEEKKEEEKIDKVLLQAAINGDADAQFELSQIYLHSNLTVNKNKDKAKEWLELAYRNGSIKAAERIKVEKIKEEEKAKNKLLQMALNGNADAQFELSQIYLHGNLVVSKNQDKAKEWLELAYSNGSIKAAALIRQQEEKRLEKIKKEQKQEQEKREIEQLGLKRINNANIDNFIDSLQYERYITTPLRLLFNYDSSIIELAISGNRVAQQKLSEKYAELGLYAAANYWKNKK